MKHKGRFLYKNIRKVWFIWEEADAEVAVGFVVVAVAWAAASGALVVGAVEAQCAALAQPG